jgi:hypothetical protein
MLWKKLSSLQAHKVQKARKETRAIAVNQDNMVETALLVRMAETAHPVKTDVTGHQAKTASKVQKETRASQVRMVEMVRLV